MKLWKWFTEKPLWFQIGIIILIAFILYQIYKWIKAKAEAGNYNAAVSQSQTALNQLAQQGVTPSYGQAQYTTWANSLESLFQGCTLANDSASGWPALSEIFNNMKNDADIYALIKAYGVRTTDRCGLWNGDNSSDLSATITDHFSGAEAFLIRHSISDINDILKKNGLTFTF